MATIYEVHSQREGLEAVYETEEEAVNYVRLLSNTFGEPLKSFTIKPVVVNNPKSDESEGI